MSCFTDFPSDEGRSNFGFFFGGSIVRVTPLGSESVPSSVSSLTAVTAFTRAFAALRFWRLAFIFSELATCVRGWGCQRSERGRN